MICYITYNLEIYMFSFDLYGVPLSHFYSHAHSTEEDIRYTEVN